MAEPPKSLLTEVSWSFAEPVPQSPMALVDAACAYAADVGAQDPSRRLLQRLPVCDVRLRYEHSTSIANEGWREVVDSVRVVGAQLGRLTGAELLWELHVACAATLGDSDRRYFEGLELEPDGANDLPPTYRVILGS